jgi:hypothetical protein
MDGEYDVNEYTDEQLFRILDLNNPSDRELEAKILSMVRKYSNFGNESGNKLTQFFIDIYNRFFENDDGETAELNLKEGFETSTPSKKKYPETPNSTPQTTKDNSSSKAPQKDDLKLTKILDYSKDQLNPLLKQTIKRVISIDSQYRDNRTTTPSTNFTFNLSEPLKDVVSLSLYSIQIPYTWYTVNSDFGGNFFYLKGNSPGINNGNYDYKITIPSGNYTPIGIVNAVNVGIKKMILNYTDISFGNTQAIYNNGISDPTSGTGKCALLIDIKKVYSTGNYDLSFSEWSSPIDYNARLNTIAGYLGLNDQSYYCSTIYSYIYPASINYDPYTVTTNINYFNIVPYVGSSYINCDVSYSPITVSISLSNITSQTTISGFVNNLNSILLNTYQFDKRFSGCQIIEITNPLQYGYGNSYIRLSCKLNDNYAPIVENLKLAAVFPLDPNSLFYGSTSAFGFLTDVSDNSGNIVCELNELTSQYPVLQSVYDSSNAIISFKCIADGYTDNSYNDFKIVIPSITNYTLSAFINAVNNAANVQLPEFYNINHQFINKLPNGITFSMYQDSSGYINMNPTFSMVYTNANYKIYVTSDGSTNYLNKLFDISTNPIDISVPPIFTNPNYSSVNVDFFNKEMLVIVPNTNTKGGNSNATPFYIVFDNNTTVFNTGYDLRDYLFSVITSYQDPVTKTYPLSGSQITYTNSRFILDLQISYIIPESFYTLTLTANHNNNNINSNIWKDLSFNNTPYSLVDYSNNDYIIQNNGIIRNNQLIIKNGINDTFYINPSNQIDVFYSSGNTYAVSVKIPDNSIDGNGTQYNIIDLVNTINSGFDNNNISKGTSIKIISSQDGQIYVKFKFNLNVIFTTKDFNLVFYDPYSFASCASSSRNASSNSLQNATWDSTLGWLLGYRNSISYSLIDFSGITYPSGTMVPNNYYLSDLSMSNVCVLIGDTNVSTNLYNYFLIMIDDYVQNHLNDGLVTITNQEKIVNPGPYIYICDPTNPTSQQKIAVPADYGSPGVTYTAQQLYAFNQQVQSQSVMLKSYSSGPFVQDIFGIIPVKTAGLSIGSVYVEFGGTLQNQQRLYFGPVNIHRMTIKLLNDRGNLVDLNNANWSFSFVCEQLYKSGVS